MQISEKYLTTNDGFKIFTEIRQLDDSCKQTIIMLHGLAGIMNGEHKQLLKLANQLCSEGYKIVRFNWRGHEKSSGVDLDVSPKSFLKDLQCVVDSECKNTNYNLFGYSFGGFAISQYLCITEDTVNKIVLWGPALNPIDSSLRNPKEFCYQELFDAEQSGDFDKQGYVYFKSENWKMSKTFVKQCEEININNALKQLSGRTLIIQGTNDAFVDSEFNKKYAEEYNLGFIELDASHSLSETIDIAIEKTLNYFNS